MTRLYDTGELVINDRSPVRSGHGAVIKEYPPLTEENPYIFASFSERPWNDDAQSITSVRFGSEVAPASMAFWFADTNLSSINWSNCNTENLTSLRTAFARTKLSEVVLPPMPALTNLRFAFSEVAPLTRADFSNVGANNVTDCNSVFKGSYALEVVDLSGLAGTVEDSGFMFGNMTATAPNMGVRTIYATEELNFADATSSNNMFRSCVDLVGGAGTVYDANYRDKTYAHIDGGVSNPGYFTNKSGIKTELYVGSEPLSNFMNLPQGIGHLEKPIPNLNNITENKPLYCDITVTLTDANGTTKNVVLNGELNPKIEVNSEVSGYADVYAYVHADYNSVRIGIGRTENLSLVLPISLELTNISVYQYL